MMKNCYFYCRTKVTFRHKFNKNQRGPETKFLGGHPQFFFAFIFPFFKVSHQHLIKYGKCAQNPSSMLFSTYTYFQKPETQGFGYKYLQSFTNKNVKLCMIPSYKNYTLIIIYAIGAMCVLMTKDLVGPF